MGDDARDRAAPSPEVARTWERCAVCHGADGSGRPDGTFPKIAGQHASVIAAQLEAIRSGTRPNPVMRPHVEVLSDARDVADIAAFVAVMPRDATCETGPGDDLERGARLYGEACASCHGEAGQGDASRAVPRIACQHYRYLLRRARQLAAWGRNGHPETEPPLARWTDADLRAVMDHAARLSAGATPPAGRREPGPEVPR
jgi:cytochrome c553